MGKPKLKLTKVANEMQQSQILDIILMLASVPPRWDVTRKCFHRF